jgi:hypothetical protein
MRAFAVSFALHACCVHAQAPFQTAVGPYLFVDNEIINITAGNVFLTPGSATKQQSAPVVVQEHPWDVVHFYTALLSLPQSFVKESGLTTPFLLYYACPDGVVFNTTTFVCVAQSSDGLVWTKPLLPLFPWTDGSPTNRVWQCAPNTWLDNVFWDPNAPLSRAIVLTYEDAPRTLQAAVSADGLHFIAAGTAIGVGGFSDTQAAILHDRFRGRYIAFGRSDSLVPGYSCPATNGECRSAVKSYTNASTYLGTGWTAPEVFLAPGPPDTLVCLDVYNSAPYLDPVTGVMLLFPSSFFHIPDYESGAPVERARANDGVMDARLLVSRDGRTFSFVGSGDREPFIPRGVGGRDPQSGLYNASGSEPDAGFVFVTSSGVLDTGNPTSVDLLYWGSQTTHAGGGAYLFSQWPGAFSGILRASVRREGFVAVACEGQAALAGCTWVSVEMLLPSEAACGNESTGLSLWINAQTSVAGFIRIALQRGPNLPPIAGFSASNAVPFIGNSIRAVVGWNVTGSLITNLAPLRATPLVVNVSMLHARLYAWEWRCSAN